MGHREPQRRGRGGLALAVATALCLPAAGGALLQLPPESEGEAIAYRTSRPTDPVARLAEDLEAGRASLAWSGKNGYLSALLQALGVPASSQMLVFSKTSFQRELIAPHTPRAIYFNDDVYVGWVPGGRVVEISAADPRLGGTFYALDQRRSSRPRIARQTDECLQCHESALTRGVPGHVIRSVFSDPSGAPILSAGSYVTTHESPLEERWGGWYVTGTHGSQRHLGNQVFRSAAQAARPSLDAGANVTDLRKRFDSTRYLTPHSDIVALLVAEHQTHVHNLIARAGYGVRAALHSERMLNRELGRPESHRSESTAGRIRASVEPLVRGLLFSGEAPLAAPVRGTSGFAGEFARRGPRDSRGRSLRDLDLARRLFRHPCSYLIYSRAFDGLPPEAREQVYRRMWDVLEGRDTGAEWAHLTQYDRDSIRAILLETKPEFARFRPEASVRPAPTSAPEAARAR